LPMMSLVRFDSGFSFRAAFAEVGVFRVVLFPPFLTGPAFVREGPAYLKGAPLVTPWSGRYWTFFYRASPSCGRPKLGLFRPKVFFATPSLYLVRSNSPFLGKPGDSLLEKDGFCVHFLAFLLPFPPLLSPLFYGFLPGAI